MVGWTTNDLEEIFGSKLESHRGFSILIKEGVFAAAKTELKYRIHARPSYYLMKCLSGKPYLRNLRIKTESESRWHKVNIESLLSFKANKGDEVLIRFNRDDEETEDEYKSKISSSNVREIADIFEDFVKTDIYATIKEENAKKLEEQMSKGMVMLNEGNISPEMMAQFYGEYTDPQQDFALIKINLENMIMSQSYRIESKIIARSGSEINWDEIHKEFRNILFGKEDSLFTLSTPYDNFLQMRKMLLDLHNEQQRMGSKMDMDNFNHDWVQRNGEGWREMQKCRNEYFYEQESAYYRDLFLVMLLREFPRINRFLEMWGGRLDYSIHLRDNIQSEVGRVTAKLYDFLPNVKDSKEFVNNVETISDNVVGSMLRNTTELKLLRQKKIYTSPYGTDDCPYRELHGKKSRMG